MTHCPNQSTFCLSIEGRTPIVMWKNFHIIGQYLAHAKFEGPELILLNASTWCGDNYHTHLGSSHKADGILKLYLVNVSQALDEVSLCLVPNRHQIATPADTTIASSCPGKFFQLQKVAVALVLCPTIWTPHVVSWKIFNNSILEARITDTVNRFELLPDKISSFFNRPLPPFPLT